MTNNNCIAKHILLLDITSSMATVETFYHNVYMNIFKTILSFGWHLEMSTKVGRTLRRNKIGLYSSICWVYWCGKNNVE